MKHFRTIFAFLALLSGIWLAPARAGVVNPDISILGQPTMTWTDAKEVNGQPVTDRKRLRLDPGETEIVFDSYLNPYARGMFTLSLGSDGIGLEEGYFTILRGLPGGLNVKGGKYRVGFGKLNPSHSHTYPFPDRFRVLRQYLPGEDSFNETGISLSERLPLPGDLSVIASADYLQGDSFHPGGQGTAPDSRSGETRPAVLGRLETFTMVGERSGLEFGMSAVQGTNNVAAGTRTTVLGLDAKAKLWKSASSYLVLQAEALGLDRENAAWDSTARGFGKTTTTPKGAYIFADYNFGIRYDLGAAFERYQQPTSAKSWDQGYQLFAGYSLMEETTVFRLSWEHFAPGRPDPMGVTPDAANTLTLRVIYSMGPHKAHQF